MVSMQVQPVLGDVVVRFFTCSVSGQNCYALFEKPASGKVYAFREAHVLKPGARPETVSRCETEEAISSKNLSDTGFVCPSCFEPAKRSYIGWRPVDEGIIGCRSCGGDSCTGQHRGTILVAGQRSRCAECGVVGYLTNGCVPRLERLVEAKKLDAEGLLLLEDMRDPAVKAAERRVTALAGSQPVIREPKRRSVIRRASAAAADAWNIGGWAIRTAVKALLVLIALGVIGQLVS